MTPLPIATEIAHLSREAAGINRNAAFAALGICLRTLQDITKKGGEEITPMSPDQFDRLRAATELDVAVAMENAPFDMPRTPVELLEFYNRMLDIAGVPDADGDVCEPED